MKPRPSLGSPVPLRPVGFARLMPQHRVRSQSGSLRIDVFIVILALGIIAAVAIPMLVRTRSRPTRIECLREQKKVGLALRIFSTDHQGQWPWQVSTNQGGSREFVDDPSQAWRHFHALSNELVRPDPLRCSLDTRFPRVTDWKSAQTNAAVNLFLGLDASEELPATILAGEDNLQLDGRPLDSELLLVRSNTPVTFDSSRHGDWMPVLMGDGSIQQLTHPRLQSALRDQPGTNAWRWLIP